MNPKIILVLAPFFFHKLPPLGIAYLSSFLNSNSLEHDVYDFNIELYHLADAALKSRWQNFDDAGKRSFFRENLPQIDKKVQKIISSGAEFIGFSVFNNNLSFSFELAKYIKEQDSSKKIIFGGPEVFYLEQENFTGVEDKYKDVVDYYVIGEGEKSLFRLLQEKKSKEQVIFGEEIGDLDNIPYPTFEKFTLDKYERKNTMPILGSRGCIRRCAFCVECLLFPKYRMRSPGSIVEEIEYHLLKGTREFVFYDSLINGNLLYLDQLCDLIKEKKLKVSWEAQFLIRSDLSFKLLKKMKQAGCYNLFIGLESGSDTVLKRMHKGFALKDVEHFFYLAKKAGLNFEVSLIVGFPQETEAEFKETMEFFKKNKDYIPKIAQVNPFVLLKGSLVDANPAEYKFNNNQRYFYAKDALAKVEEMVKFFREEKIRYTRAFVNNLISFN